MALRRLEWIAAVLDILAAEQSGFRRLRASADSLADVVTTLEEAKHRGDASYLVLLDVMSAFDQLPHATILDALCAMGVSGRLLAYVGAFLSGRTMRVRVGGALSQPRAVSTGVPQGSVLSPFLFNLALARIGDYIPQLPEYEVRVAVYADDIALFASGPTARGSVVRGCVQSALDAVDEYVRGIGLTLSAAKTEAMLVHPRYGAHRSAPCFSLRGESLPWRMKVRYLGLIVDHRLKWQPAVAALRKGTKRMASAARTLLARGQGCSPTLALRLYNSVASARLLYGLPLADLSPAKWEALDTDHRAVVRQLLCLPHTSPVGATLAEAGETPISLRAVGRALGHVERLHRSSHGQQLIDRLIGFGPCPTPAWGAASSSSPALRRPAVIEEQLAGRVLVYTDGSVLRDGAASAACVAPELSAQFQCRVLCAVSSTHAELAAIDLAAELLLQLPVQRAAVLTDSRAALSILAGEDHGPTLARRLRCKLDGVCERGCDLVFQWVPSHIGLQGNEEADRLAKEAHSSSVPLSRFVTRFDVARHSVAGYLRTQHPDPRVAGGIPPRLLPPQRPEPARPRSHPATPHRLRPDGRKVAPADG
ncbi:uncharacterized protein LOC119440022 [Dermacentor silvarum]|uniref:uncharacterized protein LOC119440022 n=1 Tax=Dermacentor silvarum TaxID=543639 RepID=UPI00210165D8|nr:uncharacterized protein LOC119440022 [Dermacentor silvarum]